VLPWHAAAAIAVPPAVWATALVAHQPLPFPPEAPQRAVADAVADRVLPPLRSDAALREEKR
jgi:hypothetical protein